MKNSRVSKDTTLESLIQESLTMAPDRVCVSEIRGTEAAEFFIKAVQDGHPGVVTTLHAANPHQVLTDLILNRFLNATVISNRNYAITATSGTGMSTICRRPDEYGEDSKNVLFIEDTREI